MTDIININKNQGEIDKSISDFKLKNCYSPNSKIYPLCKGKKENKLCKNCNVYDGTEH